MLAAGACTSAAATGARSFKPSRSRSSSRSSATVQHSRETDERAEQGASASTDASVASDSSDQAGSDAGSPGESGVRCCPAYICDVCKAANRRVATLLHNRHLYLQSHLLAVALEPSWISRPAASSHIASRSLVRVALVLRRGQSQRQGGSILQRSCLPTLILAHALAVEAQQAGDAAHQPFLGGQSRVIPSGPVYSNLTGAWLVVGRMPVVNLPPQTGLLKVSSSSAFSVVVSLLHNWCLQGCSTNISQAFRPTLVLLPCPQVSTRVCVCVGGWVDRGGIGSFVLCMYMWRPFYQGCSLTVAAALTLFMKAV